MNISNPLSGCKSIHPFISFLHLLALFHFRPAAQQWTVSSVKRYRDQLDIDKPAVLEQDDKLVVVSVHPAEHALGKPIPKEPIPARDPSEVPGLTPCSYGDSGCIIEGINIALKTLYAGVPRLNLLPFDPLYAHKTLRIAQPDNAQSIVNLDFQFTDNEIFGLRDHVCTYVSGFNRDPTGEYEIRLKGPSSTLHGKYTLNGDLFRIKTRGQGYSNFTIGKNSSI